MKRWILLEKNAKKSGTNLQEEVRKGTDDSFKKPEGGEQGEGASLEGEKRQESNYFIAKPDQGKLRFKSANGKRGGELF